MGKNAKRYIKVFTLPLDDLDLSLDSILDEILAPRSCKDSQKVAAAGFRERKDRSPFNRHIFKVIRNDKREAAIA